MPKKEIEARRIGQRAYELAVGQYARATASALATALLAEISIKNKLGTERPMRLLPTVDPADPKTIYFIPTNTAIGDDTLKVTYYQSSFHINLNRLFKSNGLMPVPGTRDVYTVSMSEKMVTARGLTGFALTLNADRHETYAIRTSEVTKLKQQEKEITRKAREARKLQEVQAKIDAAVKVIKGEEPA